MIKKFLIEVEFDDGVVDALESLRDECYELAQSSPGDVIEIKILEEVKKPL